MLTQPRCSQSLDVTSPTSFMLVLILWCYSYVVLYQPIIKRSGVACKLLIIIEESCEDNKKCKLHVCRLLFTGNVTQYSFEAED